MEQTKQSLLYKVSQRIGFTMHARSREGGRMSSMQQSRDCDSELKLP